MKPVLVILLMLLLLVPSIRASDKIGYVNSPDLVTSKELLDEARNFLKLARASMEKWNNVPDQLSSAVYYAGVKDGSLGAAVALIVIYLVFLQRKTP